MAKKQRPETLTQTLTVGRPPSNFSRLLSRTIGRFAGPWMLSSCNWEVVHGRRLYRLELAWRSDVGQWARIIDPATMALRPKADLKLYDDISRLDRLRLWLLSVESRLRHLLGSA